MRKETPSLESLSERPAEQSVEKQEAIESSFSKWKKEGRPILPMALDRRESEKFETTAGIKRLITGIVENMRAALVDESGKIDPGNGFWQGSNYFFGSASRDFIPRDNGAFDRQKLESVKGSLGEDLLTEIEDVMVSIGRQNVSDSISTEIGIRSIERGMRLGNPDMLQRTLEAKAYHIRKKRAEIVRMIKTRAKEIMKAGQKETYDYSHEEKEVVREFLHAVGISGDFLAEPVRIGTVDAGLAEDYLRYDMSELKLQRLIACLIEFGGARGNADERGVELGLAALAG